MGGNSDLLRLTQQAFSICILLTEARAQLKFSHNRRFVFVLFFPETAASLNCIVVQPQWQQFLQDISWPIFFFYMCSINVQGLISWPLLTNWSSFQPQSVIESSFFTACMEARCLRATNPSAEQEIWNDSFFYNRSKTSVSSLGSDHSFVAVNTKDDNRGTFVPFGY